MTPLPRNRPSPSRWGSSWRSTSPPAAAMASNVGSSGSIAATPVGPRMPRWSGRSGWRSTIGPARPAARRAARDRTDGDRQAAAVVPVPVRQEDGLDGGQIEVQPGRVVEPHVAVRADVEQHAARLVADAAGDEHREPMAGHAEVVEGGHHVVAGAAGRRRAAQQRRHLRQLGHTGIDARQGVGLVVDDDGEHELIEHLWSLRHDRIMPRPIVRSARCIKRDPGGSLSHPTLSQRGERPGLVDRRASG